jgi:hypothetical protein
VHLRRALLLFAIVLGLSAVAASVSRTERNPAQRTPPPTPKTTTETAAPSTSTTPAPDPGTRRISFSQGGKDELRELAVGQAATVVVSVRRAGQAELEGLGASRSAEPATPAVFDVFRTSPGRFAVLFHAASGAEAERVGTLRVVRRAG